MNPIVRETLLQLYCRTLESEKTNNDENHKAIITAAIDKNEYDSDDVRRLSAQFLYNIEVEHLYHGRSDAEWLIISFVENVGNWGNPTLWVHATMSLTGLPFNCDLDHKPILPPGSLQFLGSIPSLVARLNATEAYAYTGVTTTPPESQAPDLMARFYIVLVRKVEFVWKITLSFETKFPALTLDSKLNTDDHVRAGALLGGLQLEGPS